MTLLESLLSISAIGVAMAGFYQTQSGLERRRMGMEVIAQEAFVVNVASLGAQRVMMDVRARGLTDAGGSTPGMALRRETLRQLYNDGFIPFDMQSPLGADYAVTVVSRQDDLPMRRGRYVYAYLERIRPYDEDRLRRFGMQGYEPQEIDQQVGFLAQTFYPTPNVAYQAPVFMRQRERGAIQIAVMDQPETNTAHVSSVGARQNRRQRP